ncbi:unnamed protein product [Cuscuta campestris]|uniref:Uncharacterized protein n=1 Tax=Cuscuta campestris TaxID=132261 RepID=A0A484LSV4_9ASTE|nr:unnamed protein product [Cuscuta campestris]
MFRRLSTLMNLSTRILLMAPSQVIRVSDISLKMGRDWFSVSLELDLRVRPSVSTLSNMRLVHPRPEENPTTHFPLWWMLLSSCLRWRNSLADQLQLL